MPYFDEIETLCELKQKLRKLALANHPDHGGDVRVMRDIICEYQRLAKILPDVEPSMPDAEETIPAENSRISETRRFSCPYMPTTSGGSNPHLARLASPVLSHREICLIAKTVFVYSRLGGMGDLPAFYRKLCSLIDPGQWQPYRDYNFNPRIAKQSLNLMKTKVLNRIFTAELWKLFKTSQSNLQKAA